MAEAYCEISVDLNIRDFAALTRGAVNEMAEDMESRGRTEISHGGLGFGRFARSSHVTVRSIGGVNYEVDFMARPSWLPAFEYGATSVGRPMLWIPVSRLNFHRGGVRAREYGQRLFRPRGRRVLIDTRTRKVAYVGVPSVTIQPRLNLRAIAEDAASRFLEKLQRGR